MVYIKNVLLPSKCCDFGTVDSLLGDARRTNVIQYVLEFCQME